jgi:hypothetical protein
MLCSALVRTNKLELRPRVSGPPQEASIHMHLAVMVRWYHLNKPIKGTFYTSKPLIYFSHCNTFDILLINTYKQNNSILRKLL